MKAPWDFETKQLEKPQTMRFQTQFSPHYNVDIDYYTQDAVHRLDQFIRATAISNYWYARFEGDSDLRCVDDMTETKYKWVPKNRWEWIKWRIRGLLFSLDERSIRWAIEHGDRVGHYPAPTTPLWIRNRFRPSMHSVSYQIKAPYETVVERVQDAIVAQIYLLDRYQVKPQAVLASPEIAHHLEAHWMGKYATVGMNVPAHRTFAGLPVIVCQEMQRGAIVV